MANELIVLQVRGDSARAERDLKELTDALRRMGTQAQRSGRTAETAARRQEQAQRRATDTTRRQSIITGQLGTTLRNAAKGAAAAAAAYVGIAQVKQAIDATTNLAKATLTLNRNLGLSVKTSSEFAAVASTFGADSRSLGMAFGTLSKQITSAQQGSETSQKAFQRLGLTMKEVSAQSPEQTLFDVSDGLAKMGEGFERTAAMRSLFGRGAQTLAVLLRSGSAAMKEQMAAADEMGASFGGKNLKQVEEMIAQQRRAKLATLGLQVAFTEELAPALTDGLRAFGDIVRAIRRVPEPIKIALNPISLLIKTISKIAPAAKDVWGAVSGTFRDGVATMRGFVNDIIRVLNVLPGVDIGLIGGDAASKGSSVEVASGTGGSGGRGRGRAGTTKVDKRARGGKITAPTAIVGEEAPGHPEYVIATNPAYRRRNVELWAKAGHDIGIPGFAIGGVLSDVGDFASGIAGSAISGAGDLLGKLPGVPSGLGPLTGTAEWALAQMRDFIRDRVKDLFSSSPGSAGTRRSYPMLSGDTDFTPALGMALSRMARAANQPISVTSGWRSYAEQADLYARYLAGTGNLAAPPGQSNHEDGRAADISPGREAFGGMASRFGLGFTVPSESWHIELLRRGGIVGLAGGGIIPKRPKVGARWIDAGASWDADEAYTAMRQLGIAKRIAKALSTKVHGESGGDPRAVGHDPGGTTGLGLLQITTGFNDHIIRRYGGRSGMFKPLRNFLAARDVFLERERMGVSGISGWYAPSTAPGRMLEGRIAPRAARPKARPKKKGKRNGGGGGGAAVGEDAGIDVLGDLTSEIMRAYLGDVALNTSASRIIAGFAQREGIALPGPYAPVPYPQLPRSGPGAWGMQTVGKAPDVHVTIKGDIGRHLKAEVRGGIRAADRKLGRDSRRITYAPG